MAELERRSWTEFKEAGLVWWVNRTLHLFGWCIVFEFDEGDFTVYPARTDRRGFPSDTEARGFRKLTRHLRDNAHRLAEDVVDDEPV